MTSGRLGLLAGLLLLATGVAAAVDLPVAVRRDARVAATERFVAALEPPPDLVWVYPGGRTDLAGLFGGRPAVAADRLDPESLRGFPLVLAVAAGRERRAARVVGRLRGRAGVLPVDVPGGLPAWRLDVRGARRLRARLAELLPGARVELQSGGTRKPCAWDAAAGRHRCPGHAFSWVGPTRRRFSGHRRRCVWAHPPPGEGAALRILLNVPLATELGLGLGLTDHAVRKRDGAPVDVVVRTRQAGRSREKTLSADNRRGWRWHAWPTEPGVAEVELEVRTEDAAARHFCLDLEVREAR